MEKPQLRNNFSEGEQGEKAVLKLTQIGMINGKEYYGVMTFACISHFCSENCIFFYIV